MINKCKYCGTEPKVNEIMGCFYAQCPGKYCDKWSPYEFLGMNKEAALNSWHLGNTPYQKKKLQL